MHHADAAEAFRDHEAARDQLLEPALAAVRAAILVEDLLGVVLTDEEIAARAPVDAGLPGEPQEPPQESPAAGTPSTPGVGAA